MATTVGTQAPPRSPSMAMSSSVRNNPCSMESTPARTAIPGTSGAQVWIATLRPRRWAWSTAAASSASPKLGNAPRPLRGQSPISFTQRTPSGPYRSTWSPTVDPSISVAIPG